MEGRLQTFEEDMELCCNHALVEAALADPELTHFTCEECGMILKPTMYGPVKHWSQYPVIELIKL